MGSSDPISRNRRSNFRSNLLLHFAAEVCSTKSDHTIGSQIGSSNSEPYFGPMFDPIPILRSNFTIQFSDLILRSNFTIHFHDPIFRSNFSIHSFDPIFRLAGQPNTQPGSWPAGQRGRSASQQTATRPASHPASPAASPQLATATSHRSLHLGKLKGENMFPSYFQ